MRDATIAAIATARGEAALSIVRMSGPAALKVGSAIFRGSGGELRDAPGHSVRFGRVIDATGRTVDEVVATVFRAPRSATGEDVVEFTCHGGLAAPGGVLQCMLEAGATPAEPGEFTRRAFVNGKMALEQAEAVIDLIHARSVASHRAAIRQLEGRFAEVLDGLRAGLLEMAGLVELELDFVEEDVEFADRGQLTALLVALESSITSLIETASHADRWRDGVSVVIAGRPNSGKSTLLNALVGRDRAIVSDTPGTTRDAVDAEFVLDGLLLRLTDTAGLREARDHIEAEGVRRAGELARGADIVLYVFDSGVGLTVEEADWLTALHGEHPSLAVIQVANKADLATAEESMGSGSARTIIHGATREAVSISALKARKHTEELESLLEEVRRSLPAALRDFDASAGMVNARHLRHLHDARGAVRSARAGLEEEVGGELLSMDLRTALDAVGSITGAVSNEDVLSEVFGRFCIGK